MNRKEIRKCVLAEARSWIGTPYVHQTSCKGFGTDCLGLVRGIWRKLYGCEPQATPDYSPDWNEVSGEEQLLQAARQWFEPINLPDALPGDLLLFRWKGSAVVKHVGILTDNNRFIHAYERSGVVETTLAHHW